ncbi:hypothetical protein EDD15DRAFT_2442092 [Pisolithus albus]|nr:hypothetical protein EDD15DRAFT_2442092 [Pisolithus albus]
MPTTGTPPGTARTKTPVLCNNTRSTSHASFKDPLTAQISTVTDQASGLRYLQKREFLPVGEPLTLSKLSTALHLVAQLPSVPASAIDGIRAIAYLLDHVNTITLSEEFQNTVLPSLSETVANHVVASISPHIATLQDSVTKLQSGTPQQPNPDHASDQTIAALQLDVTSTRDSIKQLEGKLSILDTLHQHLATSGMVAPHSDPSTVERIETAVDLVHSSLTDVNLSIDVLLPSLNATQTQVNTLHKHLTSHPPTPSQGPTPRQPLPQPARLYTLAKAETRARQVLFMPTPTQTLYTKNSDPISITGSISELLITLEDEDSPYVNIKSAVCLNNGNLLLELNSEAAAQWIRTPPVRETLSTKLGIDAVVKVHTFAVVVPFFPVSYDLTDPAFLSEIERENDMPPHSLHSTRWVKNPEHRKPGQCMAHALLHIGSASAANGLLRDGLYVHCTKLFPKKDKREPVRCAKCQHWGHIARDCPAALDACSACGGPHRFAVCDHPDRKYCVNCESSSHPSSSRNCPEFIRRCVALDTKHPDNTLPYFPTADSWTQASLPCDHIPTDPITSPPTGTRSLPVRQHSQHTPTPPTQPTKALEKQRKPRQMTVLGSKARQSTLDGFARRQDALTVAHIVVTVSHNK